MAESPLDNSSYEERKRLMDEINDIEKESSKSFASVLTFGKNYNKILSNIKSLKKDIKIYDEAIQKMEFDGKKLSAEELNLLTKKKGEYEKIVKNAELTTKSLSKTKIVLQGLTNEAGNFANNLNVYEFLQNADKSIRNLNTSLGASGQLADNYRKNIEEAAGSAAKLGASIQDLANAQSAFADTTGKLAPLTEQSLKRTVALSQATQMGADAAGELVGNFNTIGKSAEATANFVQTTLNSSEKIGVSGVKSIKIIKDNFDKLNRYRFQGGVDAFKQMVQFSQKTNQNLEGVFTAAEKFRTLEGAIEASAELATLGGNMAKADAFELGFLSRNDPEKFAEKLNDMTKGVYTFNQATGEFSASAVDLDRLRKMAEITGQDFEKLSVEARKASEIEFIGSKTIGLNKQDRELVAQFAQMDQTSKTFKVQIGGDRVDINKITSEQLKTLKAQEKTLEQRSIASQTFDDTFKNTVTELKTSLLPLLTGINKILTVVNSTFGDGTGGMLGKLAVLGVGATALKLASANLGAVFTKLPTVVDLFAKKGGSLATTAAKGGAEAAASAAGKGAESLGGGLSKLPSGPSMLSQAKGIAAIGVAAVGIGAGIFLAAKGVSAMADSFAKLNPDQMKGVALSLGILVGGIAAIAAVGAFAGTGLLAVGAGVALIGGGIYLAATGVGNLVEGLSKAADPKIGKNVMSLGLGMASVAGSAALLSNPLSLLGFGALTGFISVLGKSIDFNKMDQAFRNASEFMTKPSDNLDKLRDTIKAISEADLSGLSQFKNVLADFTSKPLEVQFKDKEISLQVNITNTIDGEQLGRKLQIGKRAVIEVVNARRGT